MSAAAAAGLSDPLAIDDPRVGSKSVLREVAEPIIVWVFGGVVPRDVALVTLLPAVTHGVMIVVAREGEEEAVYGSGGVDLAGFAHHRIDLVRPVHRYISGVSWAKRVNLCSGEPLAVRDPHDLKASI